LEILHNTDLYRDAIPEFAETKEIKETAESMITGNLGPPECMEPHHCINYIGKFFGK
jgi:hypothetical protein